MCEDFRKDHDASALKQKDVSLPASCVGCLCRTKAGKEVIGKTICETSLFTSFPRDPKVKEDYFQLALATTASAIPLSFSHSSAEGQHAHWQQQQF